MRCPNCGGQVQPLSKRGSPGEHPTRHTLGFGGKPLCQDCAEQDREHMERRFDMHRVGRDEEHESSTT